MSVFVPLLCCFYYYCSIVKLEVRDDDSSRSSFIVHNCFGYPLFCLSVCFVCFSIWSWEFCFLYLWRMMEFWWELNWIYRLLLIRWYFHYDNPTCPWAREISVSSEVSPPPRDLKFLSYRSFTFLVEDKYSIFRINRSCRHRIKIVHIPSPKEMVWKNGDLIIPNQFLNLTKLIPWDFMTSNKCMHGEYSWPKPRTAALALELFFFLKWQYAFVAECFCYFYCHWNLRGSAFFLLFTTQLFQSRLAMCQLH
jgi:hypothetical protein